MNLILINKKSINKINVVSLMLFIKSKIENLNSETATYFSSF